MHQDCSSWPSQPVELLAQLAWVAWAAAVLASVPASDPAAAVAAAVAVVVAAAGDVVMQAVADGRVLEQHVWWQVACEMLAELAAAGSLLDAVQ